MSTIKRDLSNGGNVQRSLSGDKSQASMPVSRNDDGSKGLLLYSAAEGSGASNRAGSSVSTFFTRVSGTVKDGFIAGAVTTVLLQPPFVIKGKQQMGTEIKSFVQLTREIAQESGLKGFFRGLFPWAFVSANAKTILKGVVLTELNSKDRSIHVNATVSGVILALGLTPCTRILNPLIHDSSLRVKKLFQDIYQKGVLSLWKGNGGATFQYTAEAYGTYIARILDKKVQKQFDVEKGTLHSQLLSFMTATFGSLLKVGLTNPFDSLKSIQQKSTGKNAEQLTYSEVIRREGSKRLAGQVNPGSMRLFAAGFSGLLMRGSFMRLISGAVGVRVSTYLIELTEGADLKASKAH